MTDSVSNALPAGRPWESDIIGFAIHVDYKFVEENEEDAVIDHGMVEELRKTAIVIYNDGSANMFKCSIPYSEHQRHGERAVLHLPDGYGFAGLLVSALDHFEITGKVPDVYSFNTTFVPSSKRGGWLEFVGWRKIKVGLNFCSARRASDVDPIDVDKVQHDHFAHGEAANWPDSSPES